MGREEVLKGGCLGAAIEGDKQAEVRYDPEVNEVKLIHSKRDITGRAFVDFVQRVRLFAEPVNLIDAVAVEKRAGELFEFFTAMVEERYPVPGQLDFFQRSSSVSKAAMKKACESSSCICPLAFSFGCASFLGGDKLESRKLFVRLKSALARVAGFEAVCAVLDDRMPRKPQEGFW